MPEPLHVACERYDIRSLDRVEVLRYLGYHQHALGERDVHTEADASMRLGQGASVDQLMADNQPAAPTSKSALPASQPAPPASQPAPPASQPAALTRHPEQSEGSPATAPKTDQPDVWSARLDAAEVRCLAIARPRAALVSFPVRRVSGHAVELEGTALVLEGADIAAHLADATQVVLMAATIGAEVDRELQRLALVDPVEQLLFDSAATALVERVADAAEAHARAWIADAGLHPSWRYSPGYGDLPLSSQPQLLASLDATRRLGITLAPSLLMQPTKSVTAIIGAHPDPQPGLASACGICALHDFCSLRASGRTCRSLPTRG